MAKLLAKRLWEMAMARDKGSGSVYQRASDGRWVGTIEAGWSKTGARRRVVVTAKTKREALVKVKERQRELAAGGLPAEGASRARTLKGYCEQYLTTTATGLRPAAFTANRSAITGWIIPTIGHIRLEQLTPAHVELVGREVLRAGKSAGTARRYQQTLIVVLKDAIKNGHPVAHNCLLASLPEVGKVDRGDIPLVDAKRLAATSLTLPDGARWLLALLAAVRPAETLGLRWSDIDLDRGTLRIEWQLKPLPYKIARTPGSGFRVPVNYEAVQLVDAYHLVRPKTGSGERVIPLVAPVVAALERWRKVCPPSPYDLVFPAVNGRPLNDKIDRRHWRELLALAGVGDYDLYEARHTTATLLRAARVDEETIIAIMGHASIKSTASYLHTDEARVRAALEGVAGRLVAG